MKLLLITHDNGVGGIWKVKENLARGFMARGNEVKILLLSAKFSEPKSNVIASGIPFEFCHVNLKKPLRAIFAHAIPAISKVYNEFKPDHVISSYYYINFLTLLALWGKPIIVCEHNSFKDFAASRNVYGIKRFIANIFNYIIVQCDRFADKIIVVSDGLGHELVSYFKLPKDKIVRIYNPVVDDGLVTLAKAPVLHPWIADKKGKVIVSVGRLILHKDYPTLIRAFYKLRQKLDCKLLLLSDGPERKNLLNLVKELGIEEYCELPGFVENQYAYMSRADVFVLTSTVEGFALVLAEALACGCQVISTDCPVGPAEVLDHGKYGTLVPMRDIDTLADAMYNVLSGQKIIPGNMLFDRANDFSVDKAIDEYYKILGR